MCVRRFYCRLMEWSLDVSKYQTIGLQKLNCNAILNITWGKLCEPSNQAHLSHVWLWSKTDFFLLGPYYVLALYVCVCARVCVFIFRCLLNFMRPSTIIEKRNLTGIDMNRFSSHILAASSFILMHARLKRRQNTHLSTGAREECSSLVWSQQITA